jgi:hypothetical protein
VLNQKLASGSEPKERRLRRAAFGALTEAENEQEEPKVPPVTLFLRFKGDGALVTSA